MNHLTALLSLTCMAMISACSGANFSSAGQPRTSTGLLNEGSAAGQPEKPTKVNASAPSDDHHADGAGVVASPTPTASPLPDKKGGLTAQTPGEVYVPPLVGAPKGCTFNVIGAMATINIIQTITGSYKGTIKQALLDGYQFVRLTRESAVLYNPLEPVVVGITADTASSPGHILLHGIDIPAGTMVFTFAKIEGASSSLQTSADFEPGQCPEFL